ncbi:uncharacterized protein FN964_003148 [Alca torda]
MSLSQQLALRPVIQKPEGMLPLKATVLHREEQDTPALWRLWFAGLSPRLSAQAKILLAGGLLQVKRIAYPAAEPKEPSEPPVQRGRLLPHSRDFTKHQGDPGTCSSGSLKDLSTTRNEWLQNSCPNSYVDVV